MGLDNLDKCGIFSNKKECISESPFDFFSLNHLVMGHGIYLILLIFKEVHQIKIQDLLI